MQLLLAYTQLTIQVQKITFINFLFILYLSHEPGKPFLMGTTLLCPPPVALVIYLSINYQKCTHMLYIFSHIFARIFFLSPIPCMNFFLDLTPPLPGYLMVHPLSSLLSGDFREIS